MKLRTLAAHPAVRGLVSFIGLVLLAGAALAPDAAACPACKEALSSQADPAAAAKLTQGWSRSIALLMGTPYLLFAGLTLYIVRSTRRARSRSRPQ